MKLIESSVARNAERCCLRLTIDAFTLHMAV